MDKEEAQGKIQKQLKATGNRRAAYNACKIWDITVWDVLDFPLLIDLFAEANDIAHTDYYTDVFLHICERGAVQLMPARVKRGYLNHSNRDKALSAVYLRRNSEEMVEIILNAINDYKWAKARWKGWGDRNRDVICKWLFKKETEKKNKKKLKSTE